MRLGSLSSAPVWMASSTSWYLRIRLLDVMHVVGGDELRRVARAELHQPLVQVHQFADVVLLQFHVESVGTEDIVVPVHAADGFLRILINQQAGNLSRHAARGADQAFGVRRQELVVDAGIIIEAFQLRGGGDLQQVVVTRLVLGQQQQVRGFLIEL